MVPNHRWISTDTSRTRNGGAHDVGKYSELNDGVSHDDADANNDASPVVPRHTSKTTTQLTLNFSKTTSSNKQANKRPHTTNNQTNNVDDDDDIDDKCLPPEIDVPNDREVDDDDDDAATADIPDPSRVYGSVVIDRQRSNEPPAKRVRGADVDERALTSWVHQAYNTNDKNHVCRICGEAKALGDSSTSSRRKHYKADHGVAFAQLEAAASKGRGAGEFTDIVQKSADQLARRHGKQLTLFDEIPAPVSLEPHKSNNN